MSDIQFTSKNVVKVILIGIISGVLLAVIQSVTHKVGISPIPKPVSLVFADKLLGVKLSLPIGLSFHVAYITFWSGVIVAVFRKKLTFMKIFWTALFMWLILLTVFFPFIGWGIFGAAVGPKVVVAALVLHLLFAVFTWALCKWVFSIKNLESGV